MIVVATSTSNLRATKSTITFSSSSSPIWPWPTTILRLGHEPLHERRRSSGSTRRGCGRSRPARRARARGGWRPPITFWSNCDDVGLDRQPVARRRLDDRHVADAHERHVQRARNRRRAHRQHVDLAAHLLDALLVRDAEALLLVDDEQAEVVEAHVLRQQAVGADDDVELALGEVARASPSAPAWCGSG